MGPRRGSHPFGAPAHVRVPARLGKPLWVRATGGLGASKVAEFQITGGPRAPESARAMLTQSFQTRLGPPVIDDLRLLVSELVTNCVLHGGATAAGAITVRTAVRDDAVRAEVCHDGPRFAAPQLDPDIETPGGLGLFLVEQMSAAWGIAEGRETCVWFELGLPA